MQTKKGQAAMEFLMTYGQAILAAIIAIGVLAYFGVFSPGRFVGASGVMSPPFGVNDFNIVNDAVGPDGAVGTNDGFNVVLLQNSGESINVLVGDNAPKITLSDGAICTLKVDAASITAQTSVDVLKDIDPAAQAGPPAVPAGNSIGDKAWNSGVETAFKANCSSGSIFGAGDAVTGDIVLNYRKAGGTIDQQSSGTLRGTVQ